MGEVTDQYFDRNLPSSIKVRGKKPTKKFCIAMAVLFCLGHGCQGQEFQNATETLSLNASSQLTDYYHYSERLSYDTQKNYIVSPEGVDQNWCRATIEAADVYAGPCASSTENYPRIGSIEKYSEIVYTGWKQVGPECSDNEEWAMIEWPKGGEGVAYVPMNVLDRCINIDINCRVVTEEISVVTGPCSTFTPPIATVNIGDLVLLKNGWTATNQPACDSEVEWAQILYPIDSEGIGYVDSSKLKFCCRAAKVATDIYAGPCASSTENYPKIGSISKYSKMSWTGWKEVGPECSDNKEWEMIEWPTGGRGVAYVATESLDPDTTDNDIRDVIGFDFVRPGPCSTYTPIGTVNIGDLVLLKNGWTATNQPACNSGTKWAQIYYPDPIDSTPDDFTGIGYVDSDKLTTCPTSLVTTPRPTTRRPTTRRPTTRRPTTPRPTPPTCKGGKAEIWIGRNYAAGSLLGVKYHNSKLWVISSDSAEHKMVDKWMKLDPRRVPDGYKGDKSCAMFFTIGAGPPESGDQKLMVASLNRDDDYIGYNGNNRNLDGANFIKSGYSPQTLRIKVDNYNTIMNENFENTSLEYDKIPIWDWEGRYNFKFTTNSYIRGILKQLGLPEKSPKEARLPGWEKPIPHGSSGFFSKKYASDDDLKKISTFSNWFTLLPQSSIVDGDEAGAQSIIER